MSLKSATSSVSFNNLINLLRKALLRMSHKTSCINFVLERNKYQAVRVALSMKKSEIEKGEEIKHQYHAKMPHSKIADLQ